MKRVLLTMSLLLASCDSTDQPGTSQQTVTVAPYELLCAGFIYKLCPVIDGQPLEAPIAGYTFHWGFSDQVLVDVTVNPMVGADVPSKLYKLDAVQSHERVAPGVTFTVPAFQLQGTGQAHTFIDGAPFSCASQTVCDAVDAAEPHYDKTVTFAFTGQAQAPVAQSVSP